MRVEDAFDDRGFRVPDLLAGIDFGRGSWPTPDALLGLEPLVTAPVSSIRAVAVEATRGIDVASLGRLARTVQLPVVTLPIAELSEYGWTTDRMSTALAGYADLQTSLGNMTSAVTAVHDVMESQKATISDALSGLSWPLSAMRDILEQGSLNRQVRHALEAIREHQLHELSPDRLPPNLRTEAETPEGRDRLQLLIGGEVLPLAYAAPEEIVAYVLSGKTPPKRERRLWKARKYVIRACKESLADVRDEELVALRDLLSQAIRAFRQEIFEPAQALAVNVLETHLQHGMESRQANHIKQGHLHKFTRRTETVYTPVSAMYRDLPVDSAVSVGDVPAAGVVGKLNRNRTAHEVLHPGQYRAENSLLAIAAATGLICLRQDEKDRAAFTRP